MSSIEKTAQVILSLMKQGYTLEAQAILENIKSAKGRFSEASITLTGFHQTNSAYDIIKSGFKLAYVNTAFLGFGFSFSPHPENDMNKKNILKVSIKLRNPLLTYEIWKEAATTLDTSNLLLASKEITKKLKEQKYDGILAFRKYGWWRNKPNRKDEILVFNPRNIKNIDNFLKGKKFKGSIVS